VDTIRPIDKILGRRAGRFGITECGKRTKASEIIPCGYVMKLEVKRMEVGDTGQRF
jgi:hypothetical protein